MGVGQAVVVSVVIDHGCWVLKEPSALPLPRGKWQL
jgi:hypothetical protein